MYAIIRSGGKQYRVREGDRIAVERLDAAEGDTVTIGDVLLLETDGNTQVGTPVVDGASVTARVERQMRDRWKPWPRPPFGVTPKVNRMPAFGRAARSVQRSIVQFAVHLYQPFPCSIRYACSLLTAFLRFPISRSRSLLKTFVLPRAP